MQIGIIGLGFVGNAIYQSLLKKHLQQNVIIYDKFKDGGIGKFDDILISDILFLALPTLYNRETKKYEYGPIEETLKLLQEHDFKGSIVIKSTVTPEATYNLENTYKLPLIHNPEFLTARTANEDFHNQKHVVLGKGNLVTDKLFNRVYTFYEDNYPDAEISICSALESESMKIFCNSFYAVKIQFFTELQQLCEKNNSNYHIIKNMMIKNKWINPMHTIIPGPDGNISYGGLCFPKDTNALCEYMKTLDSPNKVLENCILERNVMRHDNDNCI